MSSICLGMSTIISLAMFYYSFSEADSGKVLLFIILSGAQGILVGGPCARLAQHDLVQITEGNPQDIYIILVIYTLVKCVLSTITLYLIGYCLERGKDISTCRSFIHVSHPACQYVPMLCLRLHHEVFYSG